RVGDGELEVVSTGFLVEESTALMWRGLMLTKAVEQFVADVAWGALDYLLIDMPPGTGDVQMGLARLLPRTSVVIVTTPAIAAQKVAQRAADMARRSFLPVVGVIENMSAFVCDHGQTYELVGSGGGAALAAENGAPLLGQVPLEPSVAAGNDAGTPVALDGQGPAAETFRAIAREIVERVAPPKQAEEVDMAGCSARRLDAVTAAFDAQVRLAPVVTGRGSGYRRARRCEPRRWPPRRAARSRRPIRRRRAAPWRARAAVGTGSATRPRSARAGSAPPFGATRSRHAR